MVTDKRDNDTRERAQQSANGEHMAGATLPGDEASGAGRDWRGRLDELREERRKRKFTLRRLKEPLIGLTLAGAAAPLAYGANQLAPERAGGATGDAAEATRRSSAMPEDIEDAVGTRWAEAQAEQTRDATIQGAMAQYGIGRDLAEAIYDTALEENIEPEVAYGLVRTESTFRQRAVSSVGARGLTQVMPKTAMWFMPEIGSAQALFDAETNLTVGFRYLRHLLDKYDGDTRLALLAYNRGPGTVDRILDRGGDPDNGYARKVLQG